MPLTNGYVLRSRYRIEALLGQGGMGAVYRAHDLVLDRPCAVKELVPPPGLDVGQADSVRRQFQSEAQILARLDHPGLPHVMDYFTEGLNVWLVMDFVEGQSLEDLIRSAGKKGLPEDKVLDWGTQVIKALAYCHSQGVIHRDVKPANIIIRPDPTSGPNGRAVLVDFGLVKRWDPDNPLTRTSIHGMGTPEYAPPEQYHGGAGHTEPRSDLYSLGATLYHALTGQVPPTATMRIATPGSFQRPRILRSDVSPRTEAAVLKAMELSVDARHRNAAAMATALTGTAILPGIRRPQKAAGGRRGALRWVLVALCGLLAVAVLLAVASFTGWPFDLKTLVGRAIATATSPATATPAWTPTVPASPVPIPTHTSTPLPSPSPSSTSTVPPTDTLPPTSTPLPAEPTATLTSVPTQPLPPTATRVQPTATSKPTASNPPPKPPTGGGRIAFAVYDPGISNYTLYVVNPDGTGVHAVANYVHLPDMSPNGARIVVDGVGGGKDDLWSLKIDGSDWQQLTRHSDDSYPNWGPNSSSVSFASTRQGDGAWRLYQGDSLMTTPTTGQVLGSYPIWLPTWEIVYGGCDYGWGTGASCGLWRMVNGGLPSRVTSDPQDVPTDGDTNDVLFLRPEGGNWDIFRVGLGGGVPTNLTNSPGRDGPATFSPDGRAIAFISERSGTWALYTMNRNGGGVVKLLDLPGGGNYDASPYQWNTERISWAAQQAAPTAVPTSSDTRLPAPQITFPIPDDTVSPLRETTVKWTWSGQLGASQGFQVRLWWVADNTPLGVAAPVSQTEATISFGLTDAYLRHGDGLYYLDVVVVEVDTLKVLSLSAPIRVKVMPK
jgi:serine/threonine protein kinase